MSRHRPRSLSAAAVPQVRLISSTERTTMPYERRRPKPGGAFYGRNQSRVQGDTAEIIPDAASRPGTSWLFGRAYIVFPDTILTLAANRPASMWSNAPALLPTYTVDLARGDRSVAVRMQAWKKKTEILHLGRTRAIVTWFNFAQEIVRSAVLATTVLPVSSQQSGNGCASRERTQLWSPAGLRAFWN